VCVCVCEWARTHPPIGYTKIWMLEQCDACAAILCADCAASSHLIRPLTVLPCSSSSCATHTHAPAPEHTYIAYIDGLYLPTRRAFCPGTEKKTHLDLSVHLAPSFCCCRWRRCTAKNNIDIIEPMLHRILVSKFHSILSFIRYTNLNLFLFIFLYFSLVRITNNTYFKYGKSMEVLLKNIKIIIYKINFFQKNVFLF